MEQKTTSPRIFSGQELLKMIDSLVGEEKHLEAARLLRNIEDTSLLSDMHIKLLNKARVIEEAMAELLTSPREEWTKQGESHGKHDFTIYYKVEDGARLTCRIESPIPHSLLVPLLSVLNESTLYDTWIPSWQTPFKLGVQESNQLLHDSRGHQVIQVSVSVPWPMKPREALFSVQAVDEIDTNGIIIAKMTSIGNTDEGQVIKECLPRTFSIPRQSDGMERCDFGGIVIFRQCPSDHPNYKATRNKFPDEHLILTQFMVDFDAKMTMVPKSMINFITRTALGTVWNMLLKVAEQVRDRIREEHCEMIAQKSDFYQWVEERCDYMLHQTKNEHKNCVERVLNTGQKNGLQEHNELKAEHGNDVWTLQEILRMNM